MSRIPFQTSKTISTFTFLATVLVVMCHADDNMPQNMRTCLVRYLGGSFSDANVCNFFFLSGFLLARRFGEESWWKKAILSRLRTLAVPYVFWCLAYYLLLGHFMEISNMFHLCDSGFSAAVIAIAGILRRIFGIGLLVPPCDFPLWYIKTLFYFVAVSVFVFPFLLRSRMRFAATLSAIFGFFAIGHGLQLGIMPYFGFCFHLLGFCAFLIGAYCAANGMQTLPEWMIRVNPLVPLAIWVVVSAICFICASRVDGYGFLLDPVNVAVSVFCLVWISYTVKWSVPEKLAKCTFVIYAAHMVVLKCLARILFHASDRLAVLFFICLVAIAIALCVGGAYALHWASPCLCEYFTGGRFERRT